MQSKFLTAEWRNLVMANWVVDQAILKPFIPPATQLDFWDGKCYISLVGFMFLNTKVIGIPIPFHQNFEEVNLRFYVKYNDKGEWKRGVVFLKEIVPRAAVTFIANTLYKEHYVTLPMSHSWEDLEDEKRIKYSWKTEGKWNSIQVTTEEEPLILEENSEAEFITEHYWGYTKVNEKAQSEYKVEHPSWRVFNVKDYQIEYTARNFYGAPFDDIMRTKPVSVFLAEGSEIVVRRGVSI